MFIYPQEATQEELDLTMNFEIGQVEHRYAAGDPRLVVWIPNGWAHVMLH